MSLLSQPSVPSAAMRSPQRNHSISAFPFRSTTRGYDTHIVALMQECGGRPSFTSLMTQIEPIDRTEPPAVSAAGAMRPRVVIIGAGFAGLNAAQALAKAPVDVTLIDRRNYHLFQPLLYQVATAGLSPADIATPIRSIFRHQKNTDVLLAEATGVDSAAREIE